MLSAADARSVPSLPTSVRSPVSASALARAAWVSEALSQTQVPSPLNAEQVTKLKNLRGAYEELSESYEAMRRMVERGYLTMPAAPAG